MEVEVQRMKKRMRIILALSVMLFFLTACGQEDDKNHAEHGLVFASPTRCNSKSNRAL